MTLATSCNTSCEVLALPPLAVANVDDVCISGWPLGSCSHGASHVRYIIDIYIYIYICIVHICDYVCVCVYVCVCASSTAQGGGGNFKNRKPIGEIGCCESQMAERIHWWTERWLGLCFLERLQWLLAIVTWSVTSPTSAGCSVV